MFMGRKKELQELEQAWQENSFAMSIIYGGHGIGKTRLLEEFARDKDAIFFTPGTNNKCNITELAKLAEEFGIETSTRNLSQIFNDIFKAAQNRRLLFIIDGFPNLEVSDYHASVELRKLIVKHQNSRLFLVLSSTSSMFWQRFHYEHPLFAYRTMQLEMEALSFFDCLEFFSGTNTATACELYGLAGGVPAYLRKLDPKSNLHANLLAAFLKPSAYFFKESRMLLNRQFEQSKPYAEILKIINSRGAATGQIVAEMAEFDIDGRQCGKMIENLHNAGILQKTSVWNDAYNPLWEIANYYFVFWYAFLADPDQTLKNGQSETCASYIEKNYNNYMESVFRKICLQWLLKRYTENNLPVSIMRIGRWQSRNSNSKKRKEIDIVVTSFDNDMLFADCKWQDVPVDAAQIDKLVKKAQLVKKSDNCAQFFYCFSKSGFTPQAIARAKELENFQLISLLNMAATIKTTPD